MFPEVIPRVFFFPHPLQTLNVWTWNRNLSLQLAQTQKFWQKLACAGCSVQCCRHGWNAAAAASQLGPGCGDRNRAALWLKVTPHCPLIKPLFMCCLHSNFGPEPKYIEWSGLFSLCGVGCFVLIKQTLEIFLVLAFSASFSISAVCFQRTWTWQQKQQQKRQQKKRILLLGTWHRGFGWSRLWQKSPFFFLVHAQMERGKIPSEGHSFNVTAALLTGTIPSYIHVFISDYFWWGELPWPCCVVPVVFKLPILLQKPSQIFTAIMTVFFYKPRWNYTPWRFFFLGFF